MRQIAKSFTFLLWSLVKENAHIKHDHKTQRGVVDGNKTKGKVRERNTLIIM